MKCSKCNTTNPDDNQFCGKCGTSLIEIPATPTSTITKDIPKKSALDFAPGQYFSKRYQVIEEIGRGGMGRVYKAADKELSRIVALKMIKPERSADPDIVEKFKKEINLASQISHDNVCRIHDLGEIAGIKYISMQYIEGQNLREFIQTSKKLSTETAIPIIEQICHALTAAHKKGVIHRDLKPKNIMLDKKGNAYVMDFGIAKSLEAEDTTKSGVVMGTPAYISPEQAEGEKADTRSDIYSLGAIMYEMMTGEPPFKADSIPSLLHKHVTEAPKPPSQLNPQIPNQLEKIIMKCLKKSPEKRYQEPDEIINAIEEVKPEIIVAARPAKLRWMQIVPLAAIILIGIAIGFYYFIIKEKPPTPPVQTKWKNSIAVLPFRDLSPQKDQPHFCKGMCDDIIVKLNQIKGLKVISVTSETLDKGIDIVEIAKERDWSTVLHGSFQKERDDIRITCFLTKVEDESTIWSKTYDRKFKTTFDVQDEIAIAIANALKVQLLPDTLEALKSRKPKDVEAYEYYMKGRDYIDKKYTITHKEEDFETAIRMYEKAIEIDPNYALAYWGLGDAYTNLFLKTQDKKDFDLMLKYLQKAYELDPNLPEANMSIGWAYFYRSDNDKAFQSFRRALEIDPNSPSTNYHVGSFLRSIGLYRKAIDYYSRAIEHEPLNIWTLLLIANCYLSIGEFEKSTIYINKGLEIEPKNLRILLEYARNLIWIRKYNEAEEYLVRAEKRAPDISVIRPCKALLFAAKGEKEKALALIKGVPPYLYDVTSIYSLLGMKDEAIKYINEGIDKSLTYRLTYYYSYPFLINNPCYDNLRGDPRFKEIVKREKKKYGEKLKKYGKL